MDYKIRELKQDEVNILNTFLYEAIFIPDGVNAPPYEIIKKPELQVYVADFGSQKGDMCYVAEVDGKVIGAVWVRIMDDYGHVDDATPSLAISLLKEYRNYGIGTKLMERMLMELKNQGYKQISLSVQKKNYAVRMYHKVGFHIVDENDEEYIMVCKLLEEKMEFNRLSTEDTLKMKRIQSAYKDLFTILSSTNPFLVPLAFGLAVLSGVLPPVFVLASERLMTDGLSIARGELAFSAIVPTMLVFIVSAVLPDLLNLLQQVYVEPQTELIFRSAYKGRMLQKLKKLRYEHYENKESREIIDKAYGRAEIAALHLFPKYFCNALTATVATAGTLILFLKIRWWFLLTLLAPVVLERVLCFKNSFNIYEEMETYWEKEIQYEKLEKMLCEPKTIRENRLNQSSDFLIRMFQKRLGGRNREYERYYFQNLRHHFAERNISRVGQLINAGLLLGIYQTGELSFPTFVALAGAIFTTLAENLSYYTNIVANMGYHIKAYEYYDRFFNLSEEIYGEVKEVPKDCSIAFEDVSFTYPGTDRQVLSHMSFEIRAGEKISVVGMNGEGKTTMVKLLLGLFEPDSGRILIGGKPLQAYAREAREKIFGTVFQDFTRYSISLRENVGIGDVEQLSDREAVREAMQKGNVLPFLERLPKGEDTMLNRDFEGGVDLSGGQWQRIALARALMGDRPVLILDEPTSQLDPMAESELYSEFAKLAENKTSLFITHRLGSTRITNRILVISKGRVVDTGTHEELLERGGIYADMWKAQKQWYEKKEVKSHE